MGKRRIKRRIEESDSDSEVESQSDDGSGDGSSSPSQDPQPPLEPEPLKKKQKMEELKQEPQQQQQRRSVEREDQEVQEVQEVTDQPLGEKVTAELSALQEQCSKRLSQFPAGQLKEVLPEVLQNFMGKLLAETGDRHAKEEKAAKRKKELQMLQKNIAAQLRQAVETAKELGLRHPYGEMSDILFTFVNDMEKMEKSTN